MRISDWSSDVCSSDLPLAERRRKMPPERDVAGMLRSFDYAAWTARDRSWASDKSAEMADVAIEASRTRTIASFLAGYGEAGGGAAGAQASDRLLDLFLLDKVVYEIRYESA